MTLTSTPQLLSICVSSSIFSCGEPFLTTTITFIASVDVVIAARLSARRLIYAVYHKISGYSALPAGESGRGGKKI
jgi:hypothetical protein